MNQRALISVIHFFHDVHGGAFRVAWDSAQVARDRGVDVVLLCSAASPDAPASEVVSGIRVLRYQLSRADLNPITRHQHAAKRALRAELKGWRPDLIWGHTPLQHVACISLFPSALSTYTFHSPVEAELISGAERPSFITYVRANLASRFESQCLHSANKILVLSDFNRNEIAKRYSNKLLGKVRLTPGWADTDRFHPRDRSATKRSLGWRQDRPTLFTLRRLVPRMGLENLIRAAAILRQSGHVFDLRIGGTGPLHAVLKDLIRELALDSCVFLLGSIPESDLAPSYAAADVFVVPTLALEGFGLIAIEALASGTPVIVTPVGALPEILSPIEPQWITADNDPQALAATLSDFLNGKLPAHTAEQLRQYAQDHYSEQTALARFCDEGLSPA